MDIDLNDEQAELQRSARDLLSTRVPTSAVRAMEDDPIGYDPGLWKELAALGWQGVLLPEVFGGSGLGFLELTILAEEIGRSLCPAPLMSTAIAALAVLDAGSPAQQAAWLPAIAAGDAIWSVAFLEDIASWRAEDLRLRVSVAGSRVSVEGVKTFVQDAHIADRLLVIGAGAGDDAPIAVVVDRDSPGIVLEPLQTIGGDRQFVVRFDDVRVATDRVLENGQAGWIDALVRKAAILESAYLAGLCRADLELAVAHVTNRVQFGQPLGAFQAVQHACANMLTDVDGMWLAAYRAAWAVDTAQADAPLSASIAKAWASDASNRVVSMCQQVSGAMGFTKEYDAQLYFRRQKRAELFWGDADFHREQVAALLEAGRSA